MRNYLKKNRKGVDATIDSIGNIDNKLPVCNFFDNVILNKKDSIKFITHSWEGEPILNFMMYDGNEIKITIDSSKSSPGNIETFRGNSFSKVRSGSLIEYNLLDNGKFVVRLIYYRN